MRLSIFKMATLGAITALLGVSCSKDDKIGVDDNYGTGKAPDGVEAVDLGLSVKWASFNVGATKPEEYGDYFAWGEIEPYYEAGYAQENPQTHWRKGKSGYFWSCYKWCEDSPNTLTKYNTIGGFGSVDIKNTLEPADDVAHTSWGGSWRMPTLAEQEELRDSCKWTWTTQNGVNGYLVTSKKSGFTDRSIFLPAAAYRRGTNFANAGGRGYYWCSSIYVYRPSFAWYIYFDSKSVFEYNDNRNNGFSVRPVCP
jgi:hypothetical protein